MDPRTISGERRRLGVTIEAAARELHISRAAWGEIETGKIDVTHEYADRMSEAIAAAAVEVGAGK